MYLKIYGSSDDLIEIEGDIREELYVATDRGFIALSDGTLLTYDYDGDWHFNHEVAGPNHHLVEGPTSVIISPPTGDEYSHIVEIFTEDDILWITTGQCAIVRGKHKDRG